MVRIRHCALQPAPSPSSPIDQRCCCCTCKIVADHLTTMYMCSRSVWTLRYARSGEVMSAAEALYVMPRMQITPKRLIESKTVAPCSLAAVLLPAVGASQGRRRAPDRALVPGPLPLVVLMPHPAWRPAACRPLRTLPLCTYVWPPSLWLCAQGTQADDCPSSSSCAGR